MRLLLLQILPDIKFTCTVDSLEESVSPATHRLPIRCRCLSSRVSYTSCMYESFASEDPGIVFCLPSCVLCITGFSPFACFLLVFLLVIGQMQMMSLRCYRTLRATRSSFPRARELEERRSPRGRCNPIYNLLLFVTLLCRHCSSLRRLSYSSSRCRTMKR